MTSSVGIPALLEPVGLHCGDGNRPDGITIFQYERGKSLVRDITCTDTFSPSNMIRSTIQTRAAANEAEYRKRSKYASLTDTFDFQPIAVETSGVFDESTLVYLRNLRSRIASAKGDVSERTWLIQRISWVIVRGNAISIAMSCHSSSLPPVMIIFVSQCVIIIISGCKLVMKKIVVEWRTLLKIAVTWFIVKFTICQSLRFT